MKVDRIKALFAKLSGQRVLVCGDLMLDHYIWGEAHRISPEAPVPVVRVARDSWVPGGAGNVAANLRALGAEVSVLSLLGSDAAGDRLRSMLLDNGVYVVPFESGEELPATIEKTRVLVRRQQLCRIDREPGAAAYQPWAGRLGQALTQAAEGQAAVIISDYAKGIVTPELLGAAGSLAASRNNCLVAMDPKPLRQLRLPPLDLLTPNRTEALQLAGVTLDEEEEFPATEICRLIRERWQPRHLVITLGDAGMVVAAEGKPAEHIPTRAREVFDVSGAGDTVVAALTLALSLGIELREAAEFANLAAGVVVAKTGTAVPLPGEIIALAEKGFAGQ